jgi:hypothetical protein
MSSAAAATREAAEAAKPAVVKPEAAAVRQEAVKPAAAGAAESWCRFA